MDKNSVMPVSLCNERKKYVSLCTGRTEVEIAEEIGDGGSGTLKKYVTQSVNDYLAPIRARREELMQDPAYIADILADGNRRANEIANETLGEVCEAMGMVYTV